MFDPAPAPSPGPRSPGPCARGGGEPRGGRRRREARRRASRRSPEKPRDRPTRATLGPPCRSCALLDRRTVSAGPARLPPNVRGAAARFDARCPPESIPRGGVVAGLPIFRRRAGRTRRKRDRFGRDQNGRNPIRRVGHRWATGQRGRGLRCSIPGLAPARRVRRVSTPAPLVRTPHGRGSPRRAHDPRRSAPRGGRAKGRRGSWWWWGGNAATAPASPGYRATRGSPAIVRGGERWCRAGARPVRGGPGPAGVPGVPCHPESPRSLRSGKAHACSPC